MDITELLAFSAKQGASDLHLSAELPPMIRVDGDVRRINMPALSHKEVHSLIYDIMNDKQRKDYEEFLETDFSFEVPGVARFRVNAFKLSICNLCADIRFRFVGRATAPRSFCSVSNQIHRCPMEPSEFTA